jgi:3-ketosteroid 9alpha-monooxygenase subunit B
MVMTETTIGERHLLGYELQVAAVLRETADAVSITFDVPAHLRAEFEHRAGQFLTVAVPSDRVPHVARCYSLSSAPGAGTTITVKRIDGGYASAWLNRNAEQGIALRLLPPSGHFTVSGPDSDVLLAAAGSGITPVMSILRWILGSGTGRVALWYANRDRQSAIFAAELDRLVEAHPDRLAVSYWYEDERGLPTREAIAGWATELHEGDVWTCGPAPFMEVVASAVTPVRHLHREEYRSLSNDPFAPELEAGPVDTTADGDASDVEVDLDGETHRLRWPREKNLVEVLLEHGIEAPHACREGWCGSCIGHLDRGAVTMESTEGLESDDEADGFVLCCQARPMSESVKITFD